jgi:hypothetical protein
MIIAKCTRCVIFFVIMPLLYLQNHRDVFVIIGKTARCELANFCLQTPYDLVLCITCTRSDLHQRNDVCFTFRFSKGTTWLWDHAAVSNSAFQPPAHLGKSHFPSASSPVTRKKHFSTKIPAQAFGDELEASCCSSAHPDACHPSCLTTILVVDVVFHNFVR